VIQRVSRGGYFLLLFAAFAVVIMGMREAQALLSLLLLSLFLSVLCAPFYLWMQRKGLPTPVALVIVVITFLGALLLVASVAATSVAEFRQNLPYYLARLEAMTRGLQVWLADRGLRLGEVLQENLNPGLIMRYAAETLARLSSMLSNAVLIVLTVAFMLLETANLPRKLEVAFGTSSEVKDQIDAFVASLKRYMILKTATSFTTGACVSTWLVLQGVDYPFLWGLLAFLLNYVPSIGSVIAAIPVVLLSLVQLGIEGALITAFGFLLINFLIGNVTEPRLMGRGLGLSTLIVFLSLLFWGWVLGPIGMLLAVPLTMTVKLALESSRRTRWIAILLADDPAAMLPGAPVEEAPVEGARVEAEPKAERERVSSAPA
jgi:AI-2 transport protein TqsA